MYVMHAYYSCAIINISYTSSWKYIFYNILINSSFQYSTVISTHAILQPQKRTYRKNNHDHTARKEKKHSTMITPCNYCQILINAIACSIPVLIKHPMTLTAIQCICIHSLTCRITTLIATLTSTHQSTYFKRSQHLLPSAQRQTCQYT